MSMSAFVWYLTASIKILFLEWRWGTRISIHPVVIFSKNILNTALHHSATHEAAHYKVTSTIYQVFLITCGESRPDAKSILNSKNLKVPKYYNQYCGKIRRSCKFSE